MNIHIDVNSTQYFKNKSSILSFKKAVKTNKDYDLSDLSNKFVKEDYMLKVLEQTETDTKFYIVKRVSFDEVLKQEKLKRQKEVLKYKLKGLELARSNKAVPPAEKGSDLELYTEYIKLAKLITFPIPSPTDVKTNPHNYIKSIRMMQHMLNANPEHPATTYFKLLFDKYCKESDKDEPMPDLVPIPEEPSQPNVNLNELNRLLKDTTTEVKGNKLETNDTESETDD